MERVDLSAIFISKAGTVCRLTIVAVKGRASVDAVWYGPQSKEDDQELHEHIRKLFEIALPGHDLMTLASRIEDEETRARAVSEFLRSGKPIPGAKPVASNR